MKAAWANGKLSPLLCAVCYSRLGTIKQKKSSKSSLEKMSGAFQKGKCCNTLVSLFG